MMTSKVTPTTDPMITHLLSSSVGGGLDDMYSVVAVMDVVASVVVELNAVVVVVPFVVVVVVVV